MNATNASAVHYASSSSTSEKSAGAHSFPKVIHIIYNFWSTRTPKAVQQRIDKWGTTHPDYVVMRWNKKNARAFIKKEHEWFLPIYDGYAYSIQRCDALRYFLLYTIGGVYTDIDLEPVKSIDSLLGKYRTKDCLLYRSVNSNMLTNDFMASKPGNPFFKRVWYAMITNAKYRSLSKQLTVMYTTGPLMLDRVFEDWKYKKRSLVCVIPTKLVNSCDIASVKPCHNKEAYLKRHHGSGWHGADSTVINFFYTYWVPILVIVGLVFGYAVLIRKKRNEEA